jgi:hypothetical protein
VAGAFLLPLVLLVVVMLMKMAVLLLSFPAVVMIEMVFLLAPTFTGSGGDEVVVLPLPFVLPTGIDNEDDGCVSLYFTCICC